MLLLCPRGWAAARRVSHAVFLSIPLALTPALAVAAPTLSGVIVDPHGRPLVRAHVRLIQEDGGQRSGTGTSDVFTDDAGRFQIAATPNCRVEAALTGFRSTTVPCGNGQDLRIELPLAPIEETVVVTATRTLAPASQTGVSTTTFDADEIARRQTPLVADLLRTSPGAMVVQTGGPGGVTSLFVRGGESNYNAVLLDGIPLNEPGGTFNFNNLTTENLERVEVVRGANSALFGSDAMSSVVQLFTKRGDGTSVAPHISAQVDGGSYGTLHATASASGVARQWDYSLGVARLSTDNRVPNSAFDDNTVSADVGRSIGGGATLRAVARAEIGRVGTPGQTAYGRPDLDAYYEHHDVVGGITFDQNVTRRFHQRATYSLSSSHQASVNLVDDPPYTPSYQGHVAPFEFDDFAFDSHTTLRRHFASYQADFHLTDGGPAGDQRVTVLADWNGERALLDDRMSGDQVHASRNNIGVAIQHQLLWRRFASTVGARVERNDSFGTAVVPRGSAVFTLHQGSGQVGDTLLRAAAGLGIKEPTVLQTFSTSPYYLGNPNLQPERSRAVEAGIEQRFGGDRVKIDATWFDNRYRNIIGLQTTTGFNSQYFNIGLTRARGAELAGEIAPIPALRLRTGYTFVDSEILESTSSSSPVFAVGSGAFRRPRHSGFVQAVWNWERLTAEATGIAIGRYVDSDFSSLDPPILENPGRTTWDARLSYRATSKVTALLSIDNLTNRDYQEPLGYLALRRAVRAGVRVGF